MRRDNIYNRVLILMMYGLIYHCIVCGISNIFIPQEMRANLLLFLIYIPVFVFAWIRERCRKFSIFILLHAVTSGALLLIIPDVKLRIIMGACLIIMIVLSFRLRLMPICEQQEKSPSIFSVCIFILVYIIAQHIHFSQLMQISYYEMFLFLIFYAVHKSIRNTARFLKSNKDIKNIPSEQLRSLNKISLSFFLLFLVVGMVMMQHLPLDALWKGFGMVLLTILRRILKTLFRLFAKEETVLVENETADEDYEMPFEIQEMSSFMLILEKILMTAFYLFLIIIVVYFSAKILFEVYRRFYERQKADTDESEFLWKSPLQKTQLKSIRNKRERLFSGNANQKVRRVYKKYVRQKLGKTVLPTSLTPTELEYRIAQSSDDESQIPEMSPQAQQRIELYEKARYSQWECNKQDVEAMKRNTR